MDGIYFFKKTSLCFDLVHCLVFKKTLLSETDHGRSPSPEWLWMQYTMSQIAHSKIRLAVR